MNLNLQKILDAKAKNDEILLKGEKTEDRTTPEVEVTTSVDSIESEADFILRKKEEEGRDDARRKRKEGRPDISSKGIMGRWKKGTATNIHKEKGNSVTSSSGTGEESGSVRSD